MNVCNQNKWVGVAPQEAIVDRRIIGRGKHWRGKTLEGGKRPPRLGILRFRLGEKPLTRAPKARNFASTTKNN